MIDWVHQRLVEWGEWTAGRSRVGGGGGSNYPAYQLVHIRGSVGPDVLCDADAMEIDAIMARIKLSRLELYETGYQRYVQDLSNLTIAGRMRCHRDTVHARINMLHRIVENGLRERAAKIATTNA